MKRTTREDDGVGRKMPPKKRMLASALNIGNVGAHQENVSLEGEGECLTRTYDRRTTVSRSSGSPTADEEGGSGDRDSPESKETSSDEDGAKQAVTEGKPPKGLILQGGRVRLPDKLFEYLCNRVAYNVLYWQTGGEAFTFDAKTAQKELLDKHFNGTKLTSFTRSLNRWGFKRVFQGILPKNLITYEHPLFKRDHPELLKHLKMPSQEKPAKTNTSKKVTEANLEDNYKKSSLQASSNDHSSMNALHTGVPSSVDLPADAQASAVASLPTAGTDRTALAPAALQQATFANPHVRGLSNEQHLEHFRLQQILCRGLLAPNQTQQQFSPTSRTGQNAIQGLLATFNARGQQGQQQQHLLLDMLQRQQLLMNPAQEGDMRNAGDPSKQSGGDIK